MWFGVSYLFHWEYKPLAVCEHISLYELDCKLCVEYLRFALETEHGGGSAQWAQAWERYGRTRDALERSIKSSEGPLDRWGRKGKGGAPGGDSWTGTPHTNDSGTPKSIGSELPMLRAASAAPRPYPVASPRLRFLTCTLGIIRPSPEFTESIK